MHSGRIADATTVLGAPEGWNKTTRGPCGSLAIRVEKTTAGIGMTSAWYPTPDEIVRIVCGAPIYLTVLSNVHPPVAMSVGTAEVMMP